MSLSEINIKIPAVFEDFYFTKELNITYTCFHNPNNTAKARYSCLSSNAKCN